VDLEKWQIVLMVAALATFSYSVAVAVSSAAALPISTWCLEVR
jgi:hypothetical protein